nr:putative sulfate exporter family transporter [Rufibacter sp. XAAS-G3-1]
MAISLGVTVGLGVLLAKVLGVAVSWGIDFLRDSHLRGQCHCGPGTHYQGIGKSNFGCLGYRLHPECRGAVCFLSGRETAATDVAPFGGWAAIAIHDTSSVVGAAVYGEEALKVATTLKLTRALWIVPMVLLTGLIYRTGDKKNVFPWFILLIASAALMAVFFCVP